MRVRFGNAEVDLASRQLWHGGREVRLSNKAFELLTMLVERRPAAVRKSEIKDRLWPDTFVSETNLPTLVAEIRDAIGDDARHGRFVRTVHGFGYSFSGDAVAVPARRAVGGDAMAWLVGATSRIGITRGENVLGREGEDVVALDSPTVSRRHARLIISPGQATLEDLDSKNGTYVNEARVTSAVDVADGDVVRIGSLVFTLRFVRPGSSTQTI